VTRETAAAVWVPNRNGLFIAIAAARAESLGIRGLVVGFNREEAATFPDNSRDYLEKQNRALGLSTANHVEVFAPTIELTKSQIVVEAMGLGVPLSEIWSCYWGGTVPCGACESCQRLQRALDHHHIRTAAHP
jgi:7-cyano-7-deazaguanine synthase